MTGWKIAAIGVGALNEGLDAFLRGLKTRHLEQAVKAYLMSRLDGPEESGLLGGLVDVFGTARRLAEHLQDVTLASMEGSSKKPPGQ